MLKSRQALGLLKAYDYARTIGKALNLHITIHWALTSDMAARVPKRIQLLLERMRKWLSRRGIPTLHIWVQEPSKGRLKDRDVPHLHLLVYVPTEHKTEFEAMLSEWVDGVLSEKAIHVEPLKATHWSWRTYLVKAVDPKTRDPELQAIIRSKGRKAALARGPVEGKRYGFSQNTLGPAARRRAQSAEGQEGIRGQV